jgi:hypothetical protein
MEKNSPFSWLRNRPGGTQVIPMSNPFGLVLTVLANLSSELDLAKAGTNIEARGLQIIEFCVVAH